MSVSKLISELLSYECFSFSWDELLRYSNKSEKALRNELSRLISKKEVINLRQGFYIILPPVYRRFGRLPLELFVDKLFKYLKKPYYVACLSAAKFHGAGHQQIQNDTVIIKGRSMRDIRKSTTIGLLTSSHWPEKNILTKKSDAGYFNISSPALTAVDLIRFQLKLGGLNTLYTVLEELAEEITLHDIKDLMTWYPTASALQRLGYILENISVSKSITSIIFQGLQKKKCYSLLLMPEKRRTVGKTGNRWKVDANTVLESDL